MVRELIPADFKAYWQLRLTALRTEPTAFASSYEEEQRKPVAQIKERFLNDCQSSNIHILGAFAGSELIGMMVLVREEKLKRRHIGWIFGVFVAAHRRGTGLGSKMLDEQIKRAKQTAGLEQLQLGVRSDNKTALTLYQSRGFETFGLEKEGLRVNGRYYDEVHMALFLGD